MKSNMSDNFLERLQHLMEARGLKTQKALADISGIKATTISEWFKQGRIPEIDKLIRIAKSLQTSVEYLWTGEEPEGLSSGEYAYVPLSTDNIPATPNRPLIPENHFEIKVAFRKDWIRRKGDPSKMSLIRVEGDSMVPTLIPGDILLIDHSRNFVDDHGGIYAIVREGGIMVKRIQALYPRKKFLIICDNPHYKQVEVNPEEIEINGKVLWFGREVER